jgi:hypothetical protein
MTDEDSEAIWGETSPIPAGWRVIAIAWSTRALRIITDPTGFMFRVEQLRRQTGGAAPKWTTVSSHQGDFEFESYPAALNDMFVKQARLKEKFKLAEHERKMAMIAAQNPTGAPVK